MSLSDLVKAAISGSLAFDPGEQVYWVAKAAHATVNAHKHHLKIYDDVRRRMGVFFPGLDLGPVRVVQDATVLARVFRSSIEATTTGDTIYCVMHDMQYTYAGMKLLIHELCHVKQMRNMGEDTFATEYGVEFVQHGYEHMPLETAAYEFVAHIPFDLEYYLNNNPDVRDAVGTGDDRDVAAFSHWLDAGISEGRVSAPNFHVQTYLARYQDLRDAGLDNYGAVLHWMENGIAEGRTAT
jgi:hypothetical protein